LQFTTITICQNIWEEIRTTDSILQFPFQENTLDLLTRFVDTAVAVLKLHHRTGELLDSIEEDRSFLEQALADVGDLHETLIGTFKEVASARPDEDVVTILVQGASDQVSRYLDDGKDRLRTKVEERIARTKAEVLGLHAESLEHLGRFFVRSGVPVNSQALRCELQEGQYLAEADILDMNGVRCGYKLDAASIDFFSASRRFGDLMPGRQELPVDTRRAWLKKEPVVQTMRPATGSRSDSSIRLSSMKTSSSSWYCLVVGMNRPPFLTNCM